VKFHFSTDVKSKSSRSFELSTGGKDLSLKVAA